MLQRLFLSAEMGLPCMDRLLPLHKHLLEFSFCELFAPINKSSSKRKLWGMKVSCSEVPLLILSVLGTNGLRAKKSNFVLF